MKLYVVQENIEGIPSEPKIFTSIKEAVETAAKMADENKIPPYFGLNGPWDYIHTRAYSPFEVLNYIRGHEDDDYGINWWEVEV